MSLYKQTEHPNFVEEIKINSKLKLNQKLGRLSILKNWSDSHHYSIVPGTSVCANDRTKNKQANR